MKKYNHKKIEKKIQKYWVKNNIFNSKINKKKKKYYCLCMLPYPSGKLHMGHVRNYTIGDIIARYKRMNNKNVLHPIGWDSFGLPAENAAIKNNISPHNWTSYNIKYMKKQLLMLGISYDWNKEINTCKINYYKWEQLLFIKLFKHKLIYKKKSKVNWCPKDKTVLANEQVISNKCWRCNSIIKYKNISQWFIKITKYANKLLKDLKELKYWPKKVKKMQKKWIGKCKGIEIKLFIDSIKKYIKIFVSKIIDIFNSVCISISIDHKIISIIKKKNNKLYKKIKTKIYNNKKKCFGIYTKLYTINPTNNKILPIWITNFTEENYNTKAIFIIKNYCKKHNIFIEKYNFIHSNTKYTEKKNNLYIKKIKNILLKKKIIKKKINFKIKDWVISRQKYWGVPIPIEYYNNSYKLVNENKLPIILPKLKNKNFSSNYLKKNKSWNTYKIKNKKIKRETDTLDTFIESSWYYLRYTSPNYNLGIFDVKKANYWLPVDIYIGGIEHATMHLIYFRFMHKFFKKIGFLKSNEPVKKLICQGIVLVDTYYYINKKKKKIWVNFKKVEKKILNNKKIFLLKNKNIKLKYIGKQKMSKSKNNGVNPIKIIKKYGADTLRLFIIFSTPIEKNLEWNENNILGCYRFLNRLWNLVLNFKKKNKKKINVINNNYSKKQIYIKYFLNKIIYEINKNINIKNNFNTVISKIMEFTNILINYQIINKKDYLIKKKSINKILILIYPFTPHISFYLWKKMINKNTIDKISWPKVNKKYLNIKIKIKIAIQIDGKTKKKIFIYKNEKKKKIINSIYKNNLINKFIKNKKYILNIIYIKNKIINFVTKK